MKATKMKPFVRILTALLILTMLLVGCGTATASKPAASVEPATESATATTTEAATEATPEATPVAAAEPVTINYTSFRSDDEVVMKGLIEKFQTQNPQIMVNYSVNKDAGAYYQVLKASILSNEDLDVFDIHPSADFINFISAGYMADLSDMEFNKVYSEGAKAITVIDGKNYGYLNAVNMILCFYNKTIFSELGLTVPNSFDEFASTVKKLRENKYNGVAYLGADVGGVWLGHAMIAEEAGSQGMSKYWADVDSGALTNIKDNPAVYAALQSLDAIRTQKLLYDDASTIKYDICNTLFAQKKAAIMMQGTWTVGTSEKDFPGIDYGIFPFPTLNKADVAYAEPAQVTCVYANSPNADAAKKFVEFLASPEIAGTYINTVKQTSTILGVKADFAGADLLAGIMSKGVSILPVRNYKNNDIWEAILTQMYAEALFGGGADKAVAEAEAALKKADFANQK